MRRNKFLEKIGFHYLLNKNSNEMHDVRVNHKNCHLDKMTNVRYFFFKKSAIRQMRRSKWVNGCRWCLKKWDTG